MKKLKCSCGMAFCDRELTVTPVLQGGAIKLTTSDRGIILDDAGWEQLSKLREEVLHAETRITQRQVNER